ARLPRPRLELDARVEILRVLAHDHDVDILVARADARVGLTGAQARIEAELVAQGDVDRPEAGADRSRDRPLESDPRLLDRGERLGGKRRSGLLHHLDPRLADLPVELDPGRLEYATRRFGQLGTGPIARDQGHSVRHPAADSTGAHVRGSPVDSPRMADFK